MVCGGSIISKYHILTAAHCVCKEEKNEKCEVRSGSHLNNYGGQLTDISRIVCHKRYNLIGNHDNDIAILVLKRGLQFSEKIRKIPLSEKDPKAHEKARVSGWGYTNAKQEIPDELHETMVEIVDRKQCLGQYYGARMPGRFCAGSNDSSKICGGDSGGPLVVGGYLAGIVSMGPRKCGRDVLLGLYTSVAYYRSWIERKINETLPNAEEEDFFSRFWKLSTLTNNLGDVIWYDEENITDLETNKKCLKFQWSIVFIRMTKDVQCFCEALFICLKSFII